MLAPIPKFSHMLTQILTRVSTFFRINRPISELFAEVCLNCLQKNAFVQIKISFFWKGINIGPTMIGLTCGLCFLFLPLFLLHCILFNEKKAKRINKQLCFLEPYFGGVWHRGIAVKILFDRMHAEQESP